MWFGATVDNKCQKDAKCCPLPRHWAWRVVVERSRFFCRSAPWSEKSQTDSEDNDVKLHLPLQPHICMKDCKMDKGKDWGKTLQIEPGGGCQTGVRPEQAEIKEHGHGTFSAPGLCQDLCTHYCHVISPPTLSA